jgi:hypothetical protein
MRRWIIACLALSTAACLQRPAPPVAQEPRPAPFDGLMMLARQSLPERNIVREDFRYDRSIRSTGLEGLRYYFYAPGQRRSVIGFAFENDGSPTINPVGLKREGAKRPRREYAFLFADRARENIHLAINDDVKVSGRFSHDNMFREMHFFPRRQLPALRVEPERGLLRVTLPTGEPVEFDRDTMEITGGVLAEKPIDLNPNRHARRNPDVRYTGQYLAISIAQRGEAPRRARVWGQTKYAEVHYPAKYPKACRISPKHIWDQRPEPGDKDPKLTMLHATDDALFDVIEKQCRWDLAPLRQPREIRVGSGG